MIVARGPERRDRTNAVVAPQEQPRLDRPARLAPEGIAQASIVDNEEKLEERVHFVHERLATDAIAEQFIEGREIYVSVFGCTRLTVLPARTPASQRTGGLVPSPMPEALGPRNWGQSPAEAEEAQAASNQNACFMAPPSF